MKSGFLAAGVTDNDSEAWPDLRSMVDACKKRNSDKNLCIEQFASLCRHADARGHVPDEVFESHGFPVDSDENGKPVRRPAGISQEHLQRAKSLSHDEQKRLRRERKDETTKKQKNKLVEEKLKIMRMLENNRRCETILMELVVGPAASALPTLANVDSEQFNNKRCEF